ncbi:MAG TPA: sterol desaturase family protein, partial [Bryobacteraceae bacterium]|nr:sterol desaturase family protein [Bryobacteraceae bacterium]
MEFLRLLRERLPPAAFDAVRLTNGLILLFVLAAPLERLFAARPHKLLRRQFWTDVAYYYLSSLLPNRLLIPMLAALAVALRYGGIVVAHPWAGTWPAWIRFPAAMLVAEIGFYWGHRSMHAVGFLWRFHAVHHSAAEMDWLVNTRAHPVDLVFTRLCGYAPLYALGLAQPAA